MLKKRENDTRKNKAGKKFTDKSLGGGCKQQDKAGKNVKNRENNWLGVGTA